jgi:hypothetical protein
MRITITKGERGDRIEALRGDNSHVATTFPKKGPLPHDLVHFVVESELAIRDGFWGMVAGGRHPEEIADFAKAAGHASAKRAGIPDASIVAIVQAERAVECFEADLWGGSHGDPQTFRDVIAAGCAQSLVPALGLSDESLQRIRARLVELRGQWAKLARGESLVLDWKEGTTA